MKIRLSEDEVYEIKLPEEIDKQELQGIVTKFNFLLKSFSRFSLGSEEPVTKGEIVLTTTPKEYKTKNSKWRYLRDNRQAVIEILKAHYLKTEPIEDVFKRHGLMMTTPEVSSNIFKALKEMHKIEPKEVGVKAFPTKKYQRVIPIEDTTQ